MLLHADDATVLATTYSKLCEKLVAVEEQLNEKDLSLNFDKTFFMYIGHPDNKITSNIKLKHGVVKYTTSTIYLGTCITDNGNIFTSINSDMKQKGSNVKIKLTNFINNNETTPLKLKIKVLYACFYSVILYNCESWGCLARQKVNALFNYAIKCVLGVRQSTPNVVAYSELQPKPIDAIIAKQQLKFWLNVKDKPMIKNLILKARKYKSKYVEYYDNLEKLYTTPENAFNKHNEFFQNMVFESIANQNDTKTKIKQYYEIFENFDNNSSISHTYDSDERSRIILTRYATGSHCLEEETGRWRNVDKNSRTCKLCEDDVENLKHFLIDCPKLAEIRCKYTNFPNSVKEFFKWQLCPTVIGYLHRTRNKYGR